jgi:hypothetical protein
MQFGRHYCSATDAAAMLCHRAQTCIAHRHIELAIFFDILGFFDSLDLERCVATLVHLGVNEHTARWIHALMTACSVRLHWGNHTSESKALVRSTPQGSPLSPLLSALYTSPLLQQMSTWTDGELLMYIDDRCIFVSGLTFNSVAERGWTLLGEMVQTLCHLGLDIDKKKYDAMYFYGTHRTIHRGCPRC